MKLLRRGWNNSAVTRMSLKFFCLQFNITVIKLKLRN